MVTHRPLGQSALIGCSLVNLMLLGVWNSLLRVQDPNVSYFLTRIAPSDYLVTAGLVCLGGLVGATVSVASDRFRSGRDALSVVVLFYSLNGVRRLFQPWIGRGLGTRVAALVLPSVNLAVIVLLCLVVTITFRHRVRSALSGLAHATSIVGLVASPALALTVGRAAYIVGGVPINQWYAEERSPPRSRAHERAGWRVVIAIFDEADYSRMFTERAADRQLPEFDRLVQQGMSAMAATPPASRTMWSIPSYLVGVRLADAVPVSTRDLTLRAAGMPDSRMSCTPNLFTKAYAAGASIAIAGWLHPYCRMFGALTTRCVERFWKPPTGTFGSSLAWQVQSVIGVGALSSRRLSDGASRHEQDAQALVGAAAAAAGDSAIDLVFAHISLPHAPYLFDGAIRRWRAPFGAAGDYSDNLVAADLALGAIRAEVERAGLHDRTAFIVTSDHFLRVPSQEHPHDRRIPFIVTVPDANRARTLSRPFNTVLMSELALQLLGRRMTSAELDAWMERSIDQQHGRAGIGSDSGLATSVARSRARR